MTVEGDASTSCIKQPSKLFSAAAPSIHTALPLKTDYVERQRIKQTFSPTAFSTLASLPNRLVASNVLEAADTIALQKLTSDVPAGAPTMPTVKPANLFLEYDHMPSSYTLQDDLAREEMWDKQAKAIGGPFVPAGSTYKCKHENMLAWQAGGFTYPTLAVGDPFDPPPQECRRRRERAAEKVLYGDFKPAGRRKGYAGPTRRLLPDIVRTLHRRLLRDWRDVTFGVLATEDDMIVARFAASDVRSAPALRSYMNSLARAPGELGQDFGLHVMLDDWNRRPGDGFIYFMLRPPWVPLQRRGGGGGGGGGGSADDDATLRASSTFSIISGTSQRSVT
ncbi:hypothetical protein JKP88DRAFT_164785 [Tribonema minus]|uniref:Uncharacterized protein n=1 Tax=Tribonema minus TaxID=303371 RepID=A0A835YVD2_9STRA|nr:hypothetical protein JKP88DRAFT_164785 [Tribonema minus]